MTRRLRLFPLNAVLFPGASLHLHIFEPRYKQMIAECLESGEGFGVALISAGAEAGDTDVQPHDVGSIAEIVDVQPLPFGRYVISTVGRERFRIREILSREPYLVVNADMLLEHGAEDTQADHVADRVRSLFAEYLEMVVEFSGKEMAVELPTDVRDASFVIGDTLQVAEAVKQRLLELDDTHARLRVEQEFLERLVPQLRRVLERRREERRVRVEGGERSYRDDQERFFGKFFSLN